MGRRRQQPQATDEPLIRESGASAEQISIIGKYAAGRDIVITEHLGPGPPALNQLPPASRHFTGRQDELAQLSAILTTAEDAPPGVRPIAAIVGKPGVGKSTLAIYLAHTLKSHFATAQLYENLRSPDGVPVPSEDVLGRILRKLGIAERHIPSTLDERAAIYRSTLQGKRVLVLLDNASAKAQVEPLLPSSAGSGVLITARAWLGDLEGLYSLSLGVLDQEACLELLGKLAGESQVSADPAAGRRIIDLCGALPLAVRIAGGLLQTPARAGWTLGHFAERLADKRTRLRELQLGDLDVRATFALSYDELSPEHSKLVRWLSLLPGPNFTPPLAAALCGSSATRARALLEDLANAQLLEVLGQERYAFHELLRLFAAEAAERSETPMQRRTVVDKATRWYLEWAQAGRAVIETPGPLHTRSARRRPTNADRQGALAWLSSEWPNLLAIIDHCHETHRWDDVLRLSNAVYTFLSLQGHRADWQRVLELAVDAARRKKDPERTAEMLINLGIVYNARSRWTDAIRSYDEGLTLFRKLGRKDGEAKALHNLGVTYAGQGHREKAIRCYEESLPIRRALQDPEGEAKTIGALESARRAPQDEDASRPVQLDRARAKLAQTQTESGVVAQSQQSVNTAKRLRRELRSARRQGDRAAEASVLYNLGIDCADREEWQSAAKAYQRSIGISRAIGDRGLEGKALTNLGNVYVVQGQPQQAEEVYKLGLRILRRLGDRRHEAVCLNALGVLYHDEGRLDDAMYFFQRAVAMYHDLGDREAERLVRVNLEAAQREFAASSRRRRVWHRFTERLKRWRARLS